MSDDNDLQVYNFQGNDGEKVPETVEKLIVEEGVQELPDRLCWEYLRLQKVSLPNGLTKIGFGAFFCCKNLLEINFYNTVQDIEHGAFYQCSKLKKAKFEVSTTSAHQLQRIEQGSFTFCRSLQRIKLPSSVTFVCRGSFGNYHALMEANLSTTGVILISYAAFVNCSSLQTVSLPNTVERIGEQAFSSCPELVTVVVPLDSHSIKVLRSSFCYCCRLSNLALPKDSTAHRQSFDGCTTLHERYGKKRSRIVAGLIERFERFPIHRMCYNHSGTTAQELGACIVEHYSENSLLDRFGMTPFHVLFSTVEPSIELLKVLLDSLPHQILKWKDVHERRPLDYLNNNWTDTTKSLLNRTFQKWMIDRLGRWGRMSWTESMQSKVQEILAEEDRRRRGTLLNEAYSALEQYENAAASSLLEMALWKNNLKSGWTAGCAKRQALDREECRCLSGADVVIPNVFEFLNIPQAASEEEDSEEEDSSDEDSSEEDYSSEDGFSEEEDSSEDD